MQVTRVVLEYSDGTKKYLDAEDCQKWMVYNQQVATCAMIHGICPPYEQLNWKDEGKYKENEQKDQKEDESKDAVKEN